MSGTPASLSVRQGGRPSCGRGSAVWTGVSSVDRGQCVDGGLQCGWGSAVWKGVRGVDRVCQVDIGCGSTCGCRSDVLRMTLMIFPLFQQYSQDDPFSQAKNCHKEILRYTQHLNYHL